MKRYARYIRRAIDTLNCRAAYLTGKADGFRFQAERILKLYQFIENEHKANNI